MNDSDVRVLVGTIQEQIRQNNDSQNQILRSGLKGIRIYVDGNMETMNSKLDSVIDINTKQNHALAEQQKQINSLGVRVTKNEEHVTMVHKISRHWGKVLAGLIILVLAVSWMYHTIDFKKTIKNKTGIEFRTEPSDSTGI